MATKNYNNFKASTTPTSAIDDSSTTLNVTASTGFPDAPFSISVDDEVMNVTSTGTGLNWTVVRGHDGTTAVAHTTASPVAFSVIAEDFPTRLDTDGGYVAQGDIDLDGNTLAGMSLDDLSDVDVESTSPAVADVLVFQGVTYEELSRIGVTIEDSGAYQAGELPSHTLDDNTSTKFSGNSPGRIDYDFGTDTAISRIAIQQAEASWYSSGFSIYGSDNATDWDLLGTGTGIIGTSNIDFSTATYRYWRVLATSGDTYQRWREVDFFLSAPLWKPEANAFRDDGTGTFDAQGDIDLNGNDLLGGAFESDGAGGFDAQGDINLNGNEIVGGAAVGTTEYVLTLLDTYEANSDVCTFTGIPADCEGLKLVLNLRSNSSVSDWEDLAIRFGDGSIDTGSNYYSQRNWGSSSANGVSTYFAQPSGASPGNADNDQLAILTVEIAASYADASFETQCSWHGGRRDSQDSNRQTQGYGCYYTNNVVDQIRLYPLNGTVWEAGTVKLYGYRKTTTITTKVFDLLNSKKDSADTPDDEFESTTLDAKWTAVQGSSGTVDIAETGEVAKYDLATRPGWLLIQGGSASGQEVELRQDFTLGDGDCIVVACVWANAAAVSDSSIGADEQRLGISFNSTDTGYQDGTYLRLHLASTTEGTRIIAYNGSTVVGGTKQYTRSGHDVMGGELVFLRADRDGLKYRFYISSDGSAWMPLGSHTFGTAPNNLWIFGGVSAASDDPVPIHAVKWIRQGTGGTIDPWNPNARVAVKSLPFSDTWMEALFERPSDETVHTDDQEFVGTIGGTAVTPTGTVNWTQKGSVLVADFVSVALEDFACRLYSLTPTSSPVTIETAVRYLASSSGTPILGMVITDGTTATSNAVTLYLNGDTAGVSQRYGTLTSIASQSAGTARSGVQAGHIYLRMIWTAANTFKSQISIDGIVWFDWGLSSVSKTMTPTHFGVGVSNWGGGSLNQASFEYLRVTESDLS